MQNITSQPRTTYDYRKQSEQELGKMMIDDPRMRETQAAL